jgi:hypothetical protein
VYILGAAVDQQLWCGGKVTWTFLYEYVNMLRERWQEKPLSKKAGRVEMF